MSTLSSTNTGLYFDYPLEQGLRQMRKLRQTLIRMYFDYPLEQGLRQLSIRTRIKTTDQGLAYHIGRTCILIIH